MRIKNWRKFFESVEVSLEDIKWVLVDYDYDEKNVIGSSNDLIIYRWVKKVSDPDYFASTERIERLSKEDEWNVDFNIIKDSEVVIVFYKDNLDDSIISYLNEKYGNLKPNIKSTYTFYSETNDSLSLFNISLNKRNQSIVALEEKLYKIPAYCYGISYGDNDEKLVILFKRWLLETYNIKTDYIHLV
jgi:hypothetical protein